MNQNKPALPLANAPSFIESQFPVARISMESYAERRSNQSQSITSLGKWWGRKPLVLVRAALLGLLLPVTDNPEQDREIFLKLMTMDSEGLRRRKSKPIPTARLLEELHQMAPGVRRRYLEEDVDDGTFLLRKLDKNEKETLQLLIFDRLPYAEKLEFCVRPEQIDGPSTEAWVEINAHLQTKVTNLHDLVNELGMRRFGHRPKVGDAFCGGGSIPFEAARIGCDVYASDLNPVATLLTWAALNIVGGNEQIGNKVREAQREVYNRVDRQITEWGIEHNSQGWRADAFLYCSEVVDPESGWRIPLASSWLIAPKSGTIARLVPDFVNKRYDIEIIDNATPTEIEAAMQSGTIKDSRLIPPHGGTTTPIEVIRRKMRMWEFNDIIPKPDDIFQERLYCIRWVETWLDGKGKEHSQRHYRAPSIADLRREEQVVELLHERFEEWRERGFLPKRTIELGDETARLQRERGWTYWHQLFTPRQLLIGGLLFQMSCEVGERLEEYAANLLSIGRYADWNSKLCRWGTGAARESIGQTFSNQALNTLYSFAGKAFPLSEGTWFLNCKGDALKGTYQVLPQDARNVQTQCDLWITDPPYADAVNYHELTEFFLAWYDKQIEEIFPTWYSDSKRSLAVKDDDASFRQSMLECYRKLTTNMTINGFQIVMFTHQEPAIWADLSSILWAAGLKVSAAWCIQTEREATGTRQGNYVQGTVLLILQKRTETEPAFLDEITHKVEAEVRRQLDSMLALDDDSDPNFGDADYQLAAYAAALRVLTERPIEEIDPAKELLRVRSRGEISPVEQVIRNAVKIACDHLVPLGFDADLWRTLAPLERFYLKGLEVESHGEYRNGVYQELARGFGAVDYTDLLASSKANETRLKSAVEFGKRYLQGGDFSATLLRHVLFAVHQAVKAEEPRSGLNWLKSEIKEYWQQRNRIEQLLEYLARFSTVGSMPHWHVDAHYARLVAGMVHNDHV